MKNEINICKAMGHAALIGMFLGHCHVAQAGWSGIINGNGIGWASVRVTSGKSGEVSQPSTSSLSPTVTTPSASVGLDNTFDVSRGLPNDASSVTVGKIRGGAGYIWTANCRAVNADKSDAPGWDPVLFVPSSSDAATSLQVLSATKQANACGAGINRYTVTWHWSGTDAGTAQQVAFYHYTGTFPPTFDPDGDFTVEPPVLPGALIGGTLVAGIGDNPAEAFGNFCGEQEGIDIFDEPPGPCAPGFEGIGSFSFCATEAELANIYMVTHGVAEAVQCGATGVFDGFLFPICAGDSTGGSCLKPAEKAKRGCIIPVTFKLDGCDGQPAALGSHSLWVRKCGSDELIPAVSADRGNTSNFFRKFGHHWIFALTTKGLSKGTWEIIAILYDGTAQSNKHSVFIELK